MDVQGYKLVGREVVCLACYRPELDAVAEPILGCQGPETLYCDNCIACVQDGPDPEPEPDVWSDRWGYL